MKWLLLLLIAGAEVSCTTLANRRDLYSPEPGYDTPEYARQWNASSRTTTATTTQTTTTTTEEPVPKPQFR